MELQYFPLKNSHIFKCKVNEKALMASIKGEYKRGDAFGYLVVFSDGFRGCFLAVEDEWKIEKEGQLYLYAIKKELNKFVSMQVIASLQSMY